MSDAQRPDGPPAVSRAAGDLIAAEQVESAVAKADAHLLTHYMPSVTRVRARASSLLFAPREPPPPGGWPVVAWAHGTTTGGQKLRAPSLSPTLDGDLTPDGSVTRYVWLIETLVAAGYAVAAPDLEGLGEIANVPAPYYSASSLARSLLAGVRAARHADARLSPRWAAMGHSEGGHGALYAERHAVEAPELDFAGAVAFAPFTSVSKIVEFNGEEAARHPERALDHVVQQNFNVGLIAVGVQVQHPDFDLGTVMGPDLERLMPSFTSKGSVSIVTDITRVIREKTIAAFSGFRADWASVPVVREFLTANDPSVMPGFSLRRPTQILQGARDVSVPERLTAAFVAKLRAAGDPVDYLVYAQADHFTILPEGMPDALAFLSQHLPVREPDEEDAVAAAATAGG